MEAGSERDRTEEKSTPSFHQLSFIYVGNEVDLFPGSRKNGSLAITCG